MSQQYSKFEITAAELITLSRSLADQLESALLQLAKHRLQEEAIQAATAAPVETNKKAVSKSNKKATGTFQVHKNITELIETNNVDWDRDLTSVSELRKYAFVNIRGVDLDSGVAAFQYTTQKAAKLNCQKHIAPNVLQTLEKNKSYIVYTSKVSGKSCWTQVIKLDHLTEREALSRARCAAAYFAELKVAGLVS